jgi:hypothetical protein
MMKVLPLPSANDAKYNLKISSHEEMDLVKEARKILSPFAAAYLAYLQCYENEERDVRYEALFITKGMLPVEFQPYALGGLSCIKPKSLRLSEATDLWNLAQHHAYALEHAYLDFLFTATMGLIESRGGCLMGSLPVRHIANHDLILVPVSADQGIHEHLPFPLHPHLKADIIAARFCLHGQQLTRANMERQTQSETERATMPCRSAQRSGCEAQKQRTNQ